MLSEFSVASVYSTTTSHRVPPCWTEVFSGKNGGRNMCCDEPSWAVLTTDVGLSSLHTAANCGFPRILLSKRRGKLSDHMFDWEITTQHTCPSLWDLLKEIWIWQNIFFWHETCDTYYFNRLVQFNYIAIYLCNMGNWHCIHWDGLNINANTMFLLKAWLCLPAGHCVGTRKRD